MFAILASFNNLGSSLSSALGVFAMDFVGIHTDLSDGGACDFSGLPSLTFYCGMLLPLVSIPLTFIFVPNINMQDTVDFETGEPVRDASVEATERAPLIAKTSEDER